MFGKILEIKDQNIIVENKSQRIQSNIINYHVVFESENYKIVGEIFRMDEKIIDILLIGEIKDNNFNLGIVHFPTVESVVRIIYKQELELILGSQNHVDSSNLLIGTSSLYEGFKITTKLNDFFSQHFAIIGNSGCGKSCGTASIIQNLFYYNNKLPQNAHIVMFDVYGEYHSAFTKISSMPNINVKNYTTNTEFPSADSFVICVPAYFLEVDDLAILLNVNDRTLIPILSKTLQYVQIFKSESEIAIKYKNAIIAKSLLESIASGKTASQITDQIVSTLNKFHTEDLNLESLIVQPGYTRTLRQCLNVDPSGKINALQFVIEFLNKFSLNTAFDVEEKGIVYSLTDIYDALEFALTSEGMLNNNSLYEKANDLRVRLNAILHSNQRKYFEYAGEFISKEQFVKSMFLTPSNEFAQLINMNFNYVEERFAKIMTKIYMKLFFNFAASLEQKGSFPIHVIIEEAHRYIQNDNDVNIIGYNIFDRITKEGRKYGLILGLITQRPSELSTTCLSQCSNFLVFRTFHPDDLKIIVSMSSNLTNSQIEKIKTLRPGNSIAFGAAFKVPLFVKLFLPDPLPTSDNVNLEKYWFGE